MKNNLVINLVLAVEFLIVQHVSAAPETTNLMKKVFTYQGQMPIKDEKVDATMKSIINTTEVVVTPPSELSEAEAACWKLINEQSAVTFALQRRVLDELKNDMKNLTMDKDLRASIEKIDTRLRENMDEALEALKRDAADEFFGALFETTEDIISLSSIIRDPKLDDEVFLTLVKAISRLGRNNQNLIQEFTDMCSFVHRSPRPRAPASLLDL